MKIGVAFCCLFAAFFVGRLKITSSSSPPVREGCLGRRRPLAFELQQAEHLHMTPSAQEQNPTARAPGVDPVHPFSIVPSESGFWSFPPFGSNAKKQMGWPSLSPSLRG